MQGFARTALLIVAMLMVSGCAAPQEKRGVSAVATFFPLYEAAKAIGGDNVTLTSIVPNGVEPHDYDPTPSQIALMGDADVFIEAGVGFGGLEGKLAGGLGNGTVVVNASQGVELRQGGGEDPSAAGIDPHIWLSPRRMMIVADGIRDGFDKADPAHAAQYDRNAAGFKAGLEQLDSDYRSGLSGCRKDTILTTHDAFGYLASDYGFKQIYISGLSPDAEPSPQKIAQLVDTARSQNITVVFYEEMVDPRIADTIAGEVGAQTMELSPLEGSKNQSDDYFSLMRKNLANLKVALECG